MIIPKVSANKSMTSPLRPLSISCWAISVKIDKWPQTKILIHQRYQNARPYQPPQTNEYTWEGYRQGAGACR